MSANNHYIDVNYNRILERVINKYEGKDERIILDLIRNNYSVETIRKQIKENPSLSYKVLPYIIDDVELRERYLYIIPMDQILIRMLADSYTPDLEINDLINLLDSSYTDDEYPNIIHIKKLNFVDYALSYYYTVSDGLGFLFKESTRIWTYSVQRVNTIIKNICFLGVNHSDIFRRMCKYRFKGTPLSGLTINKYFDENENRIDDYTINTVLTNPLTKWVNINHIINKCHERVYEETIDDLLKLTIGVIKDKDIRVIEKKIIYLLKLGKATINTLIEILISYHEFPELFSLICKFYVEGLGGITINKLMNEIIGECKKQNENHSNSWSKLQLNEIIIIIIDLTARFFEKLNVKTMNDILELYTIFNGSGRHNTINTFNHVKMISRLLIKLGRNVKEGLIFEVLKKFGWSLLFDEWIGIIFEKSMINTLEDLEKLETYINYRGRDNFKENVKEYKDKLEILEKLKEKCLNDVDPITQNEFIELSVRGIESIVVVNHHGFELDSLEKYIRTQINDNKKVLDPLDPSYEFNHDDLEGVYTKAKTLNPDYVKPEGLRKVNPTLYYNYEDGFYHMFIPAIPFNNNVMLDVGYIPADVEVLTSGSSNITSSVVLNNIVSLLSRETILFNEHDIMNIFFKDKNYWKDENGDIDMNKFVNLANLINNML